MSLSLVAIAAHLSIQDEAPPRTPRDVVAEAPAEAWREIPSSDLMVMQVDGNRVVIQLTDQFAPTHAENIRIFARTGYWDGATVYRVVDNFVSQWGNGGNPAYEDDDKPHPEGVVDNPPADFMRRGAEATILPLGSPDSFSAMAGFENGWPVAMHVDGSVSPTYCYGYVGVARGADPDTGSGSELFAVIGTPARRLDRNYALVGRVIDGAEHLSALPRGSTAAGVYAEDQRQVPIGRVAMMDQLPVDEQERFAMMPEGSASFAEYSYLNRTNLRYGNGTSGADICSVPVPIKSLDEKEG